jgi:hypothetical protein
MIIDIESNKQGHRRHVLNCIGKITLDGVAFPKDARLVYVDTERRIVRRLKVDEHGLLVHAGGAVVIEDVPLATWVKLEVEIKPTCRCSPEELKP